MPHHRPELIPDDLDNLMSWSQTLQDLLPNRLFAHTIDKLFDDLKVDVRFEESKSHLLERFSNILLGKHTLPTELFQNLFEFLT